MTILTGKVVCVTGAAGGIASSIIEQLAREGAHLALLDNDEAKLTQLAERVRGQFAVPVSWVVSDLATERGVRCGIEKVLEPFDGCIDGLVANVGAPAWGRFETLSSEQWQQSFNVNFFSHVWAVQVVLPLMQRQGGHILFIGSDQASQPDEGLAAYAAAKAGIHNLTKTLARELAPKILVNCVAPGITRTRLVEELMEYYAQRKYKTSVAEAERREIVEERKIPLGRLGEPDEVAGAALLLLTNDLTTGCILDCSGGNVRGL